MPTLGTALDCVIRRLITHFVRLMPFEKSVAWIQSAKTHHQQSHLSGDVPKVTVGDSPRPEFRNSTANCAEILCAFSALFPFSGEANRRLGSIRLRDRLGSLI